MRPFWYFFLAGSASSARPACLLGSTGSGFRAARSDQGPGDLGLQALESFLEWRAERGVVSVEHNSSIVYLSGKLHDFHSK